jgi:hypothetical protein
MDEKLSLHVNVKWLPLHKQLFSIYQLTSFGPDGRFLRKYKNGERLHINYSANKK